MALEERKYWTK